MERADNASLEEVGVDSTVEKNLLRELLCIVADLLVVEKGLKDMVCVT